MKKILFCLIGLLLSISVFAQSEAPEKRIYEDLGVVRIEKPQGVVAVGAYITIEKEYIYDHVQNNIREVKQEVYNKKSYEEELDPEMVYHYEVYFVSRSVFDGDTTSTWIEGLKIFVDGEQQLIKQFPDGFMKSIKTEPTLVYTHHSESDDVYFNIEWEKIVYEPRIRK